jgi:hypothetical protein
MDGVGECGDTKNCSSGVRRAHWACSRCSFMWCGNCRAVPQEAQAAAELQLEVAKLDKAAGIGSPGAKDLFKLAVTRKKLAEAIATCPPGSDCFTALEIEGEQRNFENIKSRFLKLCQTEAETEIRELKDNPEKLVSAAESYEKMAAEVDDQSSQYKAIVSLRREACGGAAAALDEKSAQADAAIAAVTSVEFDPFKSGGIVKVGDVEWKYDGEFLSHPTRPELKYRWHKFRFPGGNWGMKLTNAVNANDFGYATSVLWEGTKTFRFYATAAGVIEDLWVSQKLDTACNHFVSLAAGFPSWKIDGNTIEAVSDHADIKHKKAVIQGAVPPQVALFAVACGPLIDKMPAWAEICLAKFEKQREKERILRGF